MKYYAAKDLKQARDDIKEAIDAIEMASSRYQKDSEIPEVMVLNEVLNLLDRRGEKPQAPGVLAWLDLLISADEVV